MVLREIDRHRAAAAARLGAAAEALEEAEFEELPEGRRAAGEAGVTSARQIAASEGTPTPVLATARTAQRATPRIMGFPCPCFRIQSSRPYAGRALRA